MSEVIVFANNQMLVTDGGEAISITTDPVALGGYDRVTANFMVHSLWTNGGGVATVSYSAQVSNEGTNWFTVATLSDSTTAATPSPLQEVKPANGAFLRFNFQLVLGGGLTTDIAGSAFDLHALLDHI